MKTPKVAAAKTPKAPKIANPSTAKGAFGSKPGGIPAMAAAAKAFGAPGAIRAAKNPFNPKAAPPKQKFKSEA